MHQPSSSCHHIPFPKCCSHKAPHALHAHSFLQSNGCHHPSKAQNLERGNGCKATKAIFLQISSAKQSEMSKNCLNYSRCQQKVYVPSSLNDRLTERMFLFRFNYNGVRTKTKRKRNGMERKRNANESLTTKR